MRTVFVYAIILAFLLPGTALAQQGGAFAQLGFGARGMALGNAQVADGVGPASAYYNPALAPFTEQQRLSGAITHMPFDREMQFLQLAAPIRPHAGITAGVVYAGVSDIDGRDESGYHTGTFSTAEHSVFVSFGSHVTDSFTLGASIKLLRGRIDGEAGTARGISLDLGSTLALSDRLRLGFAASDLLGRYEWDSTGPIGTDGRQTTDRFPTRFRAGASYALSPGSVTLHTEGELRRTTQRVADGDTETASSVYSRVGIAYEPVEVLALNAGIDRVLRPREMRPAGGFGLDLEIGQLQTFIEYAAVYEAPANGIAHVLTLQIDL